MSNDKSDKKTVKRSKKKSVSQKQSQKVVVNINLEGKTSKRRTKRSKKITRVSSKKRMRSRISRDVNLLPSIVNASDRRKNNALFHRPMIDPRMRGNTLNEIPRPLNSADAVVRQIQLDTQLSNEARLDRTIPERITDEVQVTPLSELQEMRARQKAIELETEEKSKSLTPKAQLSKRFDEVGEIESPDDIRRGRRERKPKIRYTPSSYNEVDEILKWYKSVSGTRDKARIRIKFNLPSTAGDEEIYDALKKFRLQKIVDDNFGVVNEKDLDFDEI